MEISFPAPRFTGSVDVALRGEDKALDAVIHVEELAVGEPSPHNTTSSLVSTIFRISAGMTCDVSRIELVLEP